MQTHSLIHNQLVIFTDKTINKTFILDTGCPYSLGTQVPFTWMNKQVTTPQTQQQIGFFFTSLQQTIQKDYNIQVDYLLGLDFIQHFNIIIDFPHKFIAISEKNQSLRPFYRPISAQYDHTQTEHLSRSAIMFTAEINNIEYQTIFDTGAHIAYTTANITQGKNTTIQRDFNPASGEFETPVSQYQLNIKMEDGSITPISDVEIGDFNQATSPSHPNISSLLLHQLKLLNANLIIGYGISKTYPIFLSKYQSQSSPMHIKTDFSIHDDFAFTYDDSYLDIFGPFFNKITQNLNTELISLLKPGAKFLDIGAGTGRIAFHILDQGYEVTVIEPSYGMMSILLQKQSNHPFAQNFKAYLGNLNADMQQDINEKYDMIFMGMGVIDYFPPQALAELNHLTHQLLKDDGLLVIQPTPLSYYENTQLKGKRFERKMTFTKFENGDYFLVHQGTDHLTQRHFEEKLNYYYNTPKLATALTHFTFHQKTNDGAYPTYYFTKNP